MSALEDARRALRGSAVLEPARPRGRLPRRRHPARAGRGRRAAAAAAPREPGRPIRSPRRSSARGSTRRCGASSRRCSSGQLPIDFLLLGHDSDSSVRLFDALRVLARTTEPPARDLVPRPAPPADGDDRALRPRPAPRARRRARALVGQPVTDESLRDAIREAEPNARPARAARRAPAQLAPAPVRHARRSP